jgi:hypothetical protein
MRRASRLSVLFALVAIIVVSACSSSSSTKGRVSKAGDAMPWPAPSDPMRLARAAGLTPETAERLEFHVHAHLDVYIDGTHIVVPGGIGIDPSDPQVHSGLVNGLPAYGNINQPCAKPCISPLHTHDASGVLHTESPTPKENTLGQFFIEWDVTLDANCVGTYCKPGTPIAVYVDGKKFDGDPTTIPLSNQKEIALVIGKAPGTIPSTFG